MNPEMECALLGALFGIVVMPCLALATDRGLRYLQETRGIRADEILSGE